MSKHWTEDYQIKGRNDGPVFDYVHVPSGTVLLTTVSVSMETLNGLMNEFYTHGEIRSNWRDDPAPNPGPEA